MFQKILTFFRGNLSYDAIVADFNKATSRLRSYIEDQRAGQERAIADVAEAQAKADDHAANADLAQRTHDKIAALVS